MPCTCVQLVVILLLNLNLFKTAKYQSSSHAKIRHASSSGAVAFECSMIARAFARKGQKTPTPLKRAAL